MLNLIQGIVDFFSAIGNFISSLVSGLITLVKYTVMAVETVGLVVIYLPTTLQAIALAAISAAVIYLIVGRVK